MRDLAILVGVPLALWGALLYPGWRFYGDDVFLQSGVALALCLIPAAITFVMICRFATTPDVRLLATLGASGIRMAVCLGGGLLLHTKMADVFPAAFMMWLVVFYLVVLGLEVGLLVRRSSAEPGSVK